MTERPRCHAGNRDDSKFCANPPAPLGQAGVDAPFMTKTLETWPDKYPGPVKR